MKSVLIVAAALWSATAHADRTAVVVNGSASPQARTVVSRAFTSALAGVGWPIAEKLANAGAVARCFEDAEPWACLEPLVTDAIDRVVVVSVEPDGDRSFVLTASLVVEGGGEPARSREPCQSCSDTVLEQISRGLAMTIVSHAQRFRATLAVKTEPRGAQISFDDRPQGASPTTIVTTPGTHEITIEHDGFDTETRKVELGAGEESVLEVALTAEPARGRPTWPLIVVGAGVAAAITGTAISLNVDAPPPGEPQPKRLYSVPGISLAVAGGIAVVAGVYLYLRPGARSSPTVATVPGGGTVGWTAAF